MYIVHCIYAWVYSCPYFVCMYTYIHVVVFYFTSFTRSRRRVCFCSPCRSFSTLIKGLLGESNTLWPLRPIVRLSVLRPPEGNSRRCFAVSKSFVHELHLFFSHEKGDQLRAFSSLRSHSYSTNRLLMF